MGSGNLRLNFTWFASAYDMAVRLVALQVLHIRPRTWLEPVAAVPALAATFAGPSPVVTAAMLSVLETARLIRQRSRVSSRALHP